MKLTDMLILGVGAYILLKNTNSASSGGESPLAGYGGGWDTQTIGFGSSTKTVATYQGQRADLPNASTPSPASSLPDFSKNLSQQQFVNKVADTYGLPAANITTTEDPQILTVQPSVGTSYQVWRPAASAAEAQASQDKNMEQVNRILASGNFVTNAVVGGVSQTVKGTPQKV